MPDADVVAHFDGACQPMNPRGIATFGVVVHQGERLLHRHGGLAAPPFGLHATNNVAEYAGLIHALEWLAGSPFREVPLLVRGDSSLVIRQALGVYRVSAERLQPFHARAKLALAQLPQAMLEQIPRAQNALADAVAHEVYVDLLDADPVLRKEALPHMAPASILRRLDELGIAYPKFLSRFDADRLLAKAAKGPVL